DPPLVGGDQVGGADGLVVGLRPCQVIGILHGAWASFLVAPQGYQAAYRCNHSAGTGSLTCSALEKTRTSTNLSPSPSLPLRKRTPLESFFFRWAGKAFHWALDICGAATVSPPARMGWWFGGIGPGSAKDSVRGGRPSGPAL